MKEFTIIDATPGTYIAVAKINATNGKQALEIFKQRFSDVVPYNIHQKGMVWEMTNTYGSHFYAMDTTK